MRSLMGDEIKQDRYRARAAAKPVTWCRPAQAPAQAAAETG